ncbi:VOC family protein [Algoriphagus sp. A40]|uniref:VOC family protein n=1 Tax=Algoriphagus sp. A40 TaxID=1945863 RepID=UPI000986BA78|nr:VOC family protein [Algoriphagus sp. A40]OOG72227.1 hypothetical protein B0E43_16495 [Algoriphagus sp. A40]
MLIDHIFIASRNQGNEAKRLIKSGFLEGSHRVHPGQGTRNRKFYFENFFLEIIWENDPVELETELIRKISLTERVRFMESGFSRFGIGLENTESSDSVFKDCEFYQPVYFPEGKSFEILPNRENPDLPWTFRGPFKGPKTVYSEPLDHPNGIRKLTKATFQIPEPELKSDFVRRIQGHPQVRFESAEKAGLVLEFDGGRQGKVLDFPELDLVVSF